MIFEVLIYDLWCAAGSESEGDTCNDIAITMGSIENALAIFESAI
jgi:hypothetical protein